MCALNCAVRLLRDEKNWRSCTSMCGVCAVYQSMKRLVAWAAAACAVPAASADRIVSVSLAGTCCENKFTPPPDEACLTASRPQGSFVNVDTGSGVKQQVLTHQKRCVDTPGVDTPKEVLTQVLVMVPQPLCCHPTDRTGSLRYMGPKR